MNSFKNTTRRSNIENTYDNHQQKHHGPWCRAKNFLLQKISHMHPTAEDASYTQRRIQPNSDPINTQEEKISSQNTTVQDVQEKKPLTPRTISNVLDEMRQKEQAEFLEKYSSFFITNKQNKFTDLVKAVISPNENYFPFQQELEEYSKNEEILRALENKEKKPTSLEVENKDNILISTQTIDQPSATDDNLETLNNSVANLNEELELLLSQAKNLSTACKNWYENSSNKDIKLEVAQIQLSTEVLMTLQQTILPEEHDARDSFSKEKLLQKRSELQSTIEDLKQRIEKMKDFLRTYSETSCNSASDQEKLDVYNRLQNTATHTLHNKDTDTTPPATTLTSFITTRATNLTTTLLSSWWKESKDNT